MDANTLAARSQQAGCRCGATALPQLSPANSRHFAAGHRAACRAGFLLHRNDRRALQRADAARAERAYRDVFLMSKGHGCMIQYVILEEQGVLSRADLDAYCKPNGRLGAHPDYETPGDRGIDRFARPWAGNGHRPSLCRKAQGLRRADLLRVVRRRIPGRLDLGSHDDGRQSQAR